MQVYKLYLPMQQTVDGGKLMSYNMIDVRIRLNSIFIKFNIRFVVSFLLFYTYFFHLILFSAGPGVLHFFCPDLHIKLTRPGFYYIIWYMFA